MELADIPVMAIQPNPQQPRVAFDEEQIAELAASIREVGLLQPIVVRSIPTGYELVAGERRWRAVRSLGWASVPALIRDTADRDLLRAALLENLQRAQLNPLEEAAAYQQLLTDLEVTHDELAAQLGRSRSAISNSIRLLRLPPPVQRRVAAGVISQGHARALLSLVDKDQMEALAARIVAEGLSVRSTEEAVMLGLSEPAKRKRRALPARPVPLPAVADRLAERLDTGVSVIPGRSKGRLVIEFAGADDLARICDLLLDERHDPLRSGPPTA